MELEHARKLAMEVVEALAPACDRIVIAGSIRRRKPDPGDIEIVYIPSMVGQRVDLFNYGQTPATETVIADLVARRFCAFDTDVKRNGPKYKRLLLPAGRGDDGSNVVVELFRAEADNWGYILALRTGPAEFNRLWAARDHQGGALTPRFKLQDGYLWHNGVRCPTPDEPTFFATIGIPCWAPWERTAARLGKFLVERRLRGET